MSEEWRPVVGWERLYEVSDKGRVRSLDRIVSHVGNFSGEWHVRSRILREDVVRDGHHRVCLSRDGLTTTVQVHVLVATHFIGPAPAGAVCRHLDGDPGNNVVDNLAWGTVSDNQKDAVGHGTHKEARKTHCPRGHELVEPNLVAALSRRGKRSCRACDIAHSAKRRNPHLDWAAFADQRYLQLTNGVAA
ncbi:NUMOD4 motif-containing HNH endonuclease [Nocardia ignorata]|uniref:NUMOD4 motif-containing HNH endonuclease n=1 Tax=Nocardia ignorata TaxID=145285 RepID=UPI00082F8B8B